jgi:hypothetical protein
LRRWGARLVCVVAAVAALGGCGGEETRYNDAKIVERLNLEEATDGPGYEIADETFCTVEKKLLNDAEEVQAAEDEDELGLVIASREGNAGVTGVPPFNPECGEKAEKKLNKLDPPPAE